MERFGEFGPIDSLQRYCRKFGSPLHARVVAPEVVVDYFPLSRFPFTNSKVAYDLVNQTGLIEKDVVRRVLASPVATEHPSRQVPMGLPLSRPISTTNSDVGSISHQTGFYTSLNENDERKTRGTCDNHPRLAALKTKYGTTNLFRLNANIRPG